MMRFHKVSILSVKKNLAFVFPDIEFTYGNAGRGRQRGHCVRWTGGPTEDQVRYAAVENHFESTVKYFIREMTAEERDIWLAEQEREHKIWVAGEPARRAARKAKGVAKRTATTTLKRDTKAKLAAAFPSVGFDLSTVRNILHVAWTDGPERSAVAEITGFVEWSCKRTETPEHKRTRIAATRLTRRLVASKQRAAYITSSIERRKILHAEAETRRARIEAQRARIESQYCLPFLLAA